jgi:imidazolonepropionase-like amidohydrolase
MYLPKMGSLISYSALALGAAFFASGQTRSAKPAGNGPTESLAITDVTVIDVATGRLQNGVTVVAQGERIVAIGPRVTIPHSATRVNGKGKFLIPGLWDMHTHHQGTGADWLDLFIAKGVVGTRDMGGDLDFILPLRERVRSRAVLGPEIVASGPILDDAPPSYPYRRRVTDGQQAREAVADLKRAGVDFIKVHDHTPREVFFAVAEEAPKLGLTFVGHVPLAVKVEEAADAGIRSIEHLSNYQVFGECMMSDAYTLSDCRRFFEKLAAKGVWQTPTLAFFQTIPDVFSGQPLAHAEYASDSLLKLTRDNVEGSHLSAHQLEQLRLDGQMALKVIPDMYLLGNRFLAGCDGLVPGFCLHDELEWFTKAGFSPLQALQTTTINPARFLGREDTQGSIEVGKRADLVLLGANPLLDIRNVGHIEDVVVRGSLVTKQAIDKILASHRR